MTKANEVELMSEAAPAVEVTPEMIEAGVSALNCSLEPPEYYGDATLSPQLIVAKIYRTMRRLEPHARAPKAPSIEERRTKIAATYVLGVSDITVKEGDITPEMRQVMEENSRQLEKLLPR